MTQEGIKEKAAELLETHGKDNSLKLIENIIAGIKRNVGTHIDLDILKFWEFVKNEIKYGENNSSSTTDI
jgi:hypothetical protein